MKPAQLVFSPDSAQVRNAAYAKSWIAEVDIMTSQAGDAQVEEVADMGQNRT